MPKQLSQRNQKGDPMKKFLTDVVVYVLIGTAGMIAIITIVEIAISQI